MNDQDKESSQPFLQKPHEISQYNDKKFRWMVPHSFTGVVAIFSTSLCLMLLAYISIISKTNRRSEELDYPKFSTIQKRFTGGLKYNEQSQLFLNTEGQGKNYIGNGSEVDEAWNVFDAVQSIELDPSEVSFDGLYVDARGKVITIPDMFHRLHCLNQVRIALYDPKYVRNENTKRRMHVDHCIDYLRQNIQCRADLTLLRLFYSESAQRMMVDFEGMHTCRDFDAVLKWAWDHHTTHIEIV